MEFLRCDLRRGLGEIQFASLTADGLEGACSLGIGNFSLIIILSL